MPLLSFGVGLDGGCTQDGTPHVFAPHRPQVATKLALDGWICDKDGLWIPSSFMAGGGCVDGSESTVQKTPAYRKWQRRC